MTFFVNFLIWIGTVAAMELVANLSHKYIMHGWGWDWHRSHHEPHDNTFEKNDLYAVVFAIPSAGLILLGVTFDHWATWVGAGMTTYGFLYFVVHDGLVHERWPFRLVPKSGYVKRLVQAHRLHHAVHGKERGISFGFLYAKPVAELKAELKRLHGDKGLSAEAQRADRQNGKKT